MARGVYSVVFAGVSVSAVQDLFLVIADTTHKAVIHGVQIGAVSTAVQNLKLTGKRMPATLTAGSGGTTPTPQKTDPQDAAASFTAHVNDTSQATTSGTASTVMADMFATINGYLWFPPREDRPKIDLSEGFVISLDTAPAASMVMSGTIWVEEI
jgi:hypothetical protein